MLCAMGLALCLAAGCAAQVQTEVPDSADIETVEGSEETTAPVKKPETAQTQEEAAPEESAPETAPEQEEAADPTPAEPTAASLPPQPASNRSASASKIIRFITPPPHPQWSQGRSPHR